MQRMVYYRTTDLAVRVHRSGEGKSLGEQSPLPHRVTCLPHAPAHHDAHTGSKGHWAPSDMADIPALPSTTPPSREKGRVHEGGLDSRLAL